MSFEPAIAVALRALDAMLGESPVLNVISLTSKDLPNLAKKLSVQHPEYNMSPYQVPVNIPSPHNPAGTGRRLEPHKVEIKDALSSYETKAYIDYHERQLIDHRSWLSNIDDVLGKSVRRIDHLEKQNARYESQIGDMSKQMTDMSKQMAEMTGLIQSLMKDKAPKDKVQLLTEEVNRLHQDFNSVAIKCNKDLSSLERKVKVMGKDTSSISKLTETVSAMENCVIEHSYEISVLAEKAGIQFTDEVEVSE